MKKTWLKKITRHGLVDIDRSKYLRLDKNERVIEFERKFLDYLKKKINTHLVSAYPDLLKLRKIIAKYLGISQDTIYLSAGSDISLKTCVEVFTSPGDKVIILEPTFGMVNVYCEIYNLKKIKIGYTKNLKLNLKKLLNSISNKISLVILANPNSPTGTIIEKKNMLKILKKCKKHKIPIVIDEAYEGFYKYSYINYVKKFNNLIITRTFSKSFGLAGLRVGYAVANKNFSSLLNKFRPMYEINSIACLAIEFLIKNEKIITQHIKDVIFAKTFMIKELKKLNIDYINTHANFFHIKFKKKISHIENIFKKNKILVRKGPGVKGYENYLRFSLGSKTQMEKIIHLVKKIK